MKKSVLITIKDIARELNIAPSTVSRALRNLPDVSPATRKAVVELAEKMNYQPNLVALSLRKSKTNSIGVIVPRISRHFFSSAISGIEDVAYDSGYTVTICQSNESFLRESASAQALFSGRVEALIVSISMETETHKHLDLFSNSGIPIIFFDRTVPHFESCKVIVDDFNGAYKATEHLITQGCKNIAHISGPTNLNIYANRLNGYIKALKDYNFPVREDMIKHTKLTREDGLVCAQELFNGSSTPDGIFSASDTTAISILLYLKEKRIKIPDEVAIVGFSNEPSSSLIEPSLSTVGQPGFEMGRYAVQLFLKIKEANVDYYEPETKIFPTELIIRNSSSRRSETILPMR